MRPFSVSESLLAPPAVKAKPWRAIIAPPGLRREGFTYYHTTAVVPPSAATSAAITSTFLRVMAVVATRHLRP